MYAVAQRRTAPGLLFPVLLAVLGITVLAATMLDGLYLYGAAVVVAILAVVAAAFPEGTLLAVVAVAMLVPVDVALRMGTLPRIGPTRVLLGAFIAGLILRRMAVGLQRRPGRDVPLGIWVGLFLASAVVSSLFSVDSLKSVYTLLSLGIEQFLMFYIIYHFMQQPGFWPRLKTTIYFATAAICLLAFFEEVSHYSIMLQVYPEEYLDFRGGLLRVRSTFFHPIALACCLNLVYPFAVSDLLKSTDFSKRFALGILIIFIAAALFFTVSRGPLVAFCMETAVMLAWWSRKDTLKKAGLAAAGGLVMAGLLFTLVNNSSFAKTFDALVNPSGISFGKVSEDSSEYYRVALAKAVISRMEGNRIIYGSGPGTFFLADVQSYYAGHRHVLTAPDSAVLKLLFEYGLLGVGAFCLLVASILVTCIRAMRRARLTDDPTAYACTAAIIGFLWSNTTVSMFTILPLAMLYWMAVAGAVTAARPRGEGEPQLQGGRAEVVEASAGTGQTP